VGMDKIRKKRAKIEKNIIFLLFIFILEYNV
jgi:hypothetical protein